jgi:hypothetical protein
MYVPGLPSVTVALLPAATVPASNAGSVLVAVFAV